MGARSGSHFVFMNYNNIKKTKYYDLYTLNGKYHRLDGPSTEYNPDIGYYFINGIYIGRAPDDKAKYELAVNKYIKEQIFQ